MDRLPAERAVTAPGPLRPAGAARRLRALSEGGAGTAFAVLAPRAASFAVQWLMTFIAGPEALATFVNLTSRGTVVVALVAAGLGPTLAHRQRALASRGGRALAGAALAVLAAMALGATLAYEATVGLGGVKALVTAAFSACALFTSVAPVVWPLWQLEGRYLQTLAAQLALSPGAAVAAAFAGRQTPELGAAAACLATGLAGAAPALLLVRPTRIARAARYALILVRRSVPLSISNFATAIVFPLALSVGGPLLGGARVGQQALHWSFVAALSAASQAFATRALAGAGAGAGAAEGEVERRARALRAWLRAAAPMAVVAAALWVAFAVRIPGVPLMGAARDAMVPTLLVTGVAPLVTDPLCFYFSGPASRRPLAIGSALCSAAVAACTWLAPEIVIGHFGVYGPSAIVGVLRLAFVLDAPARGVARLAAAALVAGYAVALVL